ncbi:MAG: metallophosphoesterase family protein [Acidobacteria bacterium]|nr:metallophosphoesterase family protein [Acidobacteriota bacterium]
MTREANPFLSLPEIALDPGRPVAVLADLHANLEALTVVRAWLAREGIDQVIVLGDVVGYGASPMEVTGELRRQGWPSVLGNHDLWAGEPKEMEVPYRRIKDHARRTLLWTYEQLDPESRHFLMAQPRILRLGRSAVAIHGSLVDPEHCFAYIYDLSLYLNIRALDALAAPRPMIVFFGHTHKPAVFAVEDDSWESLTPGTTWLPLEAPVHFINPGSVGYPRDGDPRASLALWQPWAGQVKMVRLPYAVEEAAGRMEAAALPSENRRRLLEAR